METQDSIYMLAREHPSLFTSHCHRLKNYFENKATVIIANPRSGSTLLMRLLMHGCLTHTVGDRLPGVYAGLLELYKGFFNKHYQYREAMMEKEFPDMYCGYDCEKHHMIAWRRILSDVLFATPFGGCCKMTMLGWTDNHVEEFVEMLRHSFDGGLTLVWLTRDAEEVADSLISRPGGKLYQRNDLRDGLVRQCKLQQEQFRKCMDLEDARITYQQLLEDPYKCVKKCSPAYAPNREVFEKVFATKIR